MSDSPEPSPWILVVDEESEVLDLLIRSLRDEARTGRPDPSTPGDPAARNGVTLLVAGHGAAPTDALELVRSALKRGQARGRLVVTGASALGPTVDGTAADPPAGLRISEESLPRVVDLAELRRAQAENRRLAEEVTELRRELDQRDRLLALNVDEQANLLLAANRSLEQNNAVLRDLARRDGLTHLYNQRTLMERLEEELARSRRSGTPLSLLLGDLDNLRAYSELMGPLRADECLTQVASILAGEWKRPGEAGSIVGPPAGGEPGGVGGRLRSSDIPGRYGSEAFLVLLPETDRGGARIKASRLREAIERHPFTGAERLPEGRLTISFGSATYPGDGEAAAELLARAGEALSDAKRWGRYQTAVPGAAQNESSREVGSYRRLLPVLRGHLSGEGALAVISITLTQLAKVEAEYGAHLSRQLLSQLEDAVMGAVGLFGETQLLGTCADETRPGLLIFLPGRRSARCSQTANLMELAGRLEASLGHELFRLERLVHAPGRVVAGWGEGVYSSRLPVDRLIGEIADEARGSVARRLDELQSLDRTRLRQLLVEEELGFSYQPILGPEGQRYGSEALVRGPVEHGWDRPDHLFWRASEVGLLDELDRGCVLGALRGAAGRLGPTERLFVNVLPSSLYDSTFVGSELPAAVAAAGLTPNRVVLELTEQHAIESLTAFQESVRKVQQLGFSVALDDVGTGNSNLHALLELRPTFVKLDRLFIDGVADNALKRQLVGALVAATHALPAELIAEGVERDDDARELRRQGVGLFQGYLYGRPAPLPARP